MELDVEYRVVYSSEKKPPILLIFFFMWLSFSNSSLKNTFYRSPKFEGFPPWFSI